MAVNDYLLSGGLPWSPFLGQPPTKKNNGFSNLERVTDLDSYDYTSQYVSGELGDAYSVQSLSKNNINGYTPTSGYTTDQVRKIEEQDYYKNFFDRITQRDANGNLSQEAINWMKEYDKRVPRNADGSLSPITFYDENGELRKNWTFKGRNTRNELQDFTTSDPLERIKRIAFDQQQGMGHNIFINRGKRYFYKDENGQLVYVKPQDLSQYNVSENPIFSNWNKDKSIYWDDYELTLKDPNQTNNNKFVDALGIDYSKKSNNPIQRPTQFTGKIPQDIKEVEPLKQNKLLNFLPDAIASSRLWLTLRNNRKVHDIYNQSIRPVLKDTYERYSPVTGDFGMLSLKNRQAADTLFRANQPYTSDANLNVARSLEAQRQANQLQTEGHLADNQRIRETQREALLRQEDNMARRSEVANFNRAQLQDVRERRAENDALTQKANWQSWDQYLQGFEKRFRADATKRENDINEWNDRIIEQNAQRKLNIGYRNIQNRIKALEAQYGNNIPDYEQLKIQQDLERLKSALTDYQYQQKAKLSNIPYTGIYTNDQLNSIIFKHKSGGKFVPKFQRGSSIGNALAIYQDLSGPYYDTITQYELKRRYEGSGSGSSKSSSKKSSDSDSEKGAFTRKDFINSIKDANLLPNDINALYQTITGLFNRVKMMGSDVQDISQLYLQIMPMLNNAKMNRKRYDEIETKLRNEGKLYELAYYQGGVYATDSQTRKIVHISKDQLNENKQRYSPITYGQLLWCTQNMPEQAYNHSWLEAASSAISLKEVAELLKSNLYKLGTDTIKVDYFETNQQYAQAFNELKHLLAAPEGYYKLTQLLKNPTKQGEGITGLFNAAMTLLPEAAIGRLKFATQNGTGEEVHGLIAQMVAGQSDYTKEFSLSPVTTVDENGRIGTKSTKTAAEKEPNEGQWAQILTGKSGDDKKYQLLIDSAKLSVDGKYQGSLPQLKANMPLGDYLANELGQVSKNNKQISFGDIKIDVQSLNDVMINSASGAIIATLPKVPGEDRVSFKALDDLQAIQKKLDNAGYKKGSPEYEKEVASQMTELGYGYMYNSNGQPNKQFFGNFLILEGLTSDNMIGYDSKDQKADLSKSIYMKKHENSRELQDKLQVGLSTKARGEYKLDDLYNGILNPGDNLFWSSDNIYEGNIFVPLTENLLNAYNADENNLKSSQAKQFEEFYQGRDKLNIANTNNSYETE